MVHVIKEPCVEEREWRGIHEITGLFNYVISALFNIICHQTALINFQQFSTYKERTVPSTLLLMGYYLPLVLTGRRGGGG